MGALARFGVLACALVAGAAAGRDLPLALALPGGAFIAAAAVLVPLAVARRRRPRDVRPAEGPASLDWRIVRRAEREEAR